MSESHETDGSVWRWPPPLGLLWLLIPVAGMMLRVGFAVVPPHDYWWQLAFGRIIAETGSIPGANLFLYTMPAGADFIDQPWLAQWTLYRLVEQFGHIGPYLVRAAVTAVAWVGLIALARRRCRDPRVVGATALVAVVISASIFAVRSRMFALPLYVAALGVVVEVADRRLSACWLAALVPVVGLWANLHGSFALAPVLVACVGAALGGEAWIEGRDRGWHVAIPWVGAFGAVVVAGFATPIGWTIYEYVAGITLSAQVTATVSEWQPPDPASSYGALVYVSLLAGLVVLAVRRRRVRVFEAVLYATTAYLAVDSVRAVFWWAAVAVIVVPRHLAALLPADPGGVGEPTPVQGGLHVLASAALVAAVVAIQPGMPGFSARTAVLGDEVRQSPPGAGLLSSRTPLGLVDQLEESGGRGRIFHDQAIGGLLEYRLGAREPSNPRQVAFVDQRMGLVPPRIWADYFILSRAKKGWRERLDEWEVDWLALYEEKQSELIEAVRQTDQWHRVGREGEHILFERR